MQKSNVQYCYKLRDISITSTDILVHNTQSIIYYEHSATPFIFWYKHGTKTPFSMFIVVPVCTMKFIFP